MNVQDLSQNTQDVIREFSLRRLAKIFNISKNDLFEDQRFGFDLISSKANDFRLNEFDIIDNDIKDVANKYIKKEMENGLLIVSTVGDYCDHMIRCSHTNFDDVSYVLEIPKATKIS